MLHTETDRARCAPLSGNVYGIAWQAGETPVGSDISPTEPVLFFKPKNTYLPSGGTVLLPNDIAVVEARACIGLVFGSDARCVSAADAWTYVSGFVLCIDVSEPGAATLRPPIREKCRDGFLPVGIVVDSTGVALQDLALDVERDGVQVASLRAFEKASVLAEAIERVSSFMTLRAGDVLLAVQAPLVPSVCPGSELVVRSAVLGELHCRVAVEPAAAAEVSR